MVTTLLLLLKLSPVLLILLLFSPQFGGRLKRKHRKQYARSKHWKEKRFENLEETSMNFSLRNLPGFIRAQFTDRHLRSPEKPIPVVPFERSKWESNSNQPKFIWYGHSVLLLQLNGKNLLIDPMFGPDASPIAPIKTKRFSEDTIHIIDQLPKINAVLFTHDHYDHIDLKSIKKLRGKVDKWFVGLGIGRHLQRWKISPDKIQEFDWWESTEFEGIKITYTPTRHFSGRGPFDRAQSLWGGWAFKTNQHNIYFGGDGGYGKHFKEVGEKLGPFDIGFMECGQYNELWSQIHLFPEETVQAAIDAKVKTSVPVHWGGFALALHPWKDSIERFTLAAKEKNIPFSTPEIGALFTLEKLPQKDWWEHLN
jgi:L-ascorbate metabolism protein UlaG (beta-lactamase superfamily)